MFSSLLHFIQFFLQQAGSYLWYLFILWFCAVGSVALPSFRYIRYIKYKGYVTLPNSQCSNQTELHLQNATDMQELILITFFTDWINRVKNYNSNSIGLKETTEQTNVECRYLINKTSVLIFNVQAIFILLGFLNVIS